MLSRSARSLLTPLRALTGATDTHLGNDQGEKRLGGLAGVRVPSLLYLYRGTAAMNLATEKEAPPLAMDEHGAVRVGGTRVLLDLIVHAFDDGASAEEIVESYPSLTLADVYATITYILRHRDRVDEYVAAREATAAELREKIEERYPSGDLRRRLLARQASG